MEITERTMAISDPQKDWLEFLHYHHLLHGRLPKN